MDGPRLSFDLAAEVRHLAARIAADAPDLDVPDGAEADLAYIVFYASVACRDGWSGRLALAVRSAARQRLLDEARGG